VWKLSRFICMLFRLALDYAKKDRPTITTRPANGAATKPPTASSPMPALSLLAAQRAQRADVLRELRRHHFGARKDSPTEVVSLASNGLADTSRSRALGRCRCERTRMISRLSPLLFDRSRSTFRLMFRNDLVKRDSPAFPANESNCPGLRSVLQRPPTACILDGGLEAFSRMPPTSWCYMATLRARHWCWKRKPPISVLPEKRLPGSSPASCDRRTAQALELL